MISSCPHLEPYFAANDKTPLTDGHIDIHSSQSRHTKENLIGRVPVQIKGRSGPKKLRSFPISRTDLNGYLHESGVLYFVVTIEKKTGQRTAYYALLNPFKIQRFLEAMAPEQTTFSVPLKKLPDEPSKIEVILTLAHQTRKESASTGWDPQLTEHITQFTIHTDQDWDLDSPMVFTGSDLDYSVVVQTKGGLSVPVDWDVSVTPSSYMGERKDWVVCSGTHRFEYPLWRRIDKDSVEVELSEGLKLGFKELGDSRTGSIQLTMRDDLAGRRRDLGFVLGWLDNSGFTINARKLEHALGHVDGEEELRSHFNYLERLHELLLRLDVNVDLISLTEITPKQSDQLLGLYQALVHGKELPQDTDHAGRLLQPLGPWTVELLCLDGSQEGKWRFLDLFDPEIGQRFAVSVENEPDTYDSFLVTPYELIDEDKLPYVLNLHLSGIVAAYDALPETPKTFTLANHMVLRLIKAGDLVEARRTEFLAAAEALNDWLILKEGKMPHHLVNRWQLATRSGDLTAEDRQEIRGLKRAAGRGELDNSAPVEVSCAILLGDAEDVEFCLRHLDDSHLDVLRSWPIWSLWTS